MTLIPLISSTLSSRRTATATAAGPGLSLRRGGYDPGAGHRPLAATLAIGLPAALVVAVALSPMIVDKAPVIDSPEWRPIKLEKPKPPEVKPAPDAPLPRDTVIVAPRPRIDVAPRPDVVIEATDRGPPIALPPYGGTGPSVVADPPAPPPRLVLAQLDQTYLAGFQPDYPAREQREGIEGVVRVRVLIGADGRVKAVTLVNSDSPGFFEATKRRALAKWRFKPATRGGVAEESWKEMSVRFEIRNS